MDQLILREEGEHALYEAEKALAFAEGLAVMVGDTQLEIAADELHILGQVIWHCRVLVNEPPPATADVQPAHIRPAHPRPDPKEPPPTT